MGRAASVELALSDGRRQGGRHVVQRAQQTRNGSIESVTAMFVFVCVEAMVNDTARKYVLHLPLR